MTYLENDLVTYFSNELDIYIYIFLIKIWFKSSRKANAKVKQEEWDRMGSVV